MDPTERPYFWDSSGMSLINDGRPFLVGQAGDLGYKPYLLPTLANNGVLRRPFRGVYIDAAVPDDRVSRCRALALIAPSDSVIALWSAAWIHQVDTIPPNLRSSVRAEFLAPHHTARKLHRGVHTIEGYVDDADICLIDGIPVTVPDRTAVDLLRRQFRPYALSSADALHRAGLIDPASVSERIRALSGFPGVKQARELATMIDGRRESHGESWTFLRIADAGFPWPTPQVRLLDRFGREVHRLDLGYEGLMIGVEYNGRRYHSIDEQLKDEVRLASVRHRFSWRVAITTNETIFGVELNFEWQLGAWLQLDPITPRLW